MQQCSFHVEKIGQKTTCLRLELFWLETKSLAVGLININKILQTDTKYRKMEWGFFEFMGLCMRRSTPNNCGSEEKECALDKWGSASVYYYAVSCSMVGRERVVVYTQAVPSSLQDILCGSY